MTPYNDLLEAINGLKEQGYTVDFNLAENFLMCLASNRKWKPEDFKVDTFYRFEGMSNPDDNSILYAISAPDGVKGTLVNSYGVYAESASTPLLQKLATH